MTVITLQETENFREGLKAYEVMLDGVKIGEVEQFYPTFERAPRGSRVVTKRWTTKRARWAPTSDHIANGYRSFTETRKAAVATVVAVHIRAQNQTA